MVRAMFKYSIAVVLGLCFSQSLWAASPVLANIEAGAVGYTENDAATQITNTITVTDADSANLTGATITISAGFASGEDVLSFTNANGISGSFAGATMTLSGSSSVANYETALRAVFYRNTSDNPDTTARTITFTVSDGTSSNTQTRNITISATNDAPVLANLEAAAVSFTEDGGAVAVTGAITITDAENNNITGATVTITGFQSGEDVLAFTDTANITGSFATGTMTLTGSDTLANYQAALRSITFNNTSQNPNTGARSLVFQVTDGAASNSPSRGLTVNAVNDAPVLANLEAAAVSFTEDGGAVAVTSAITITDVENNNITGATVTITGFQSGQDVLAFTNTGTITGSFAAGTMTLSGTDTLANYQAALRAITFNNTSQNPNTGARTLVFQVSDGAASNSPSRGLTVNAVNDAPVLANLEAGAVSFTEDGGAVAVTSAITITDAESNNITGATVTITGFQTGEDVLAFTDTANISGSFAGGVMTLSGTDTLANYQAALRSITFNNTSQNPNTGARTLVFQVTDGDASNSPSRGLTVNAVNDAPVLANLEGTALTFSEGGAATAITSAITISDIENNNITGATVSITGFQSGADVLAFTNTGTISGSFAAGVMTLTGTDTLANYQAALRSITYQNTSQNPSTGARTLVFQVTDGDASNSPSRSLTVTASNDAPTISATTTGAAYIEGDPATVIVTGGSGTDPDATNFNTGTITVALDTYVSGDVLSVAGSPTGVGSTSGGTGADLVITLNSSATPANVGAILNALRYRNTGDNPTDFGADTSRVVSITLNDGGNSPTPDMDSNTLTGTISITAVNDAPVLGSAGAAVGYTENQGALTITSTITATDADNTNLTGATIEITGGFVSGEDVLAFTNANGISGNFSGAILTLSGSSSVANYQTALRSITYTNTSDNPSTTQRVITFIVSDGALPSTGVTRAINITAVNDVPVVDLDSGAGGTGTTANFVESPGTPVIIGVSAATITDVDNTQLQSVTVTITNIQDNNKEILDATTVAGISVNFTANTGVLVLSGTAPIADYITVLRSVTYDNTDSRPTVSPARIITVVARDTAGGDSAAATSTVTITDVNDPPINTVPSTQTINEDNTRTFSTGNSNAISVSDPDAGTDDIEVTLNITGGTLTLNGTTGLTFSVGDGTADATMTFQGAISAINSRLNGLVFTPTLNLSGNGAGAIQIVTNDLGNNGGGGAQSDTDSVSINITALNDAPVLATGTIQNLTTLEDSGAVTFGFGGGTPVTFGPGGGADEAGQTTTLFVDAVPLTTLGIVRKNGTTTVGASEAILLSELQTLQFIPATNSNSVFEPGANQLQFTVTDNGPTGAGQFNSTQFTVSVTVTPVNDRPTITQPLDPATVSEDPGPVSVQLISAVATPIAFNAGPAEESGTQTLFQYNIVSVTTSGNIAFTVAPAISNAGVLSYTLAGNVNGTAIVLFNVQDSGGTANGGQDTSINRSFTITVNAINDPPVNSVPATQTRLEDAAAATFTTPISVSDVDIAESAGSFTVEVKAVGTNPGTLTASVPGGVLNVGVTGSGSDTLTITGGNASETNAVLNTISYLSVADAFGTPADIIRVTTSDNGGTGTPGAQTDIDTFNINLTSVNDVPVRTAGTVANLTVVEDEVTTSLGLGAVTYSPGPANESGQTLTYTVTAVPPSAQALIVLADGTTTVSTGATTLAAIQGMQLRTVANANGGPYTFTYTVVDNGGTSPGVDTLSESLTITITPVNDAPVVTASGGVTAYAEAAGLGNNPSVVVDSTITASDADLGAVNQGTIPAAQTTPGTLTVAVANGEQADVLSIGNGGGVTVASGVVSVGATAIGTVTGGQNAPLVVTFNASATIANAQSVMRQVQYATVSERASEVNRDIRFTLSDAAGGTSASSSKFVSVDEVNDVVAITSSNKSPIFTFDTSGTVNTIANVALPGQNITFTIDAKDADDPITFLWDFGDGTTDAGTTVSNNVLLNDGSIVNFSGNTVTNSVTHTFTKAGVYTVRVSAKDGRGADDPSQTVQIIVNSPPRERPNTGGAQPPIDSGLIALTDFLKLTQPQTYTVLLAGLTANTDEDGDPLVYTFDLGDGTTTTVNTNSVDTTYPLLPQTAVLQENGLSSIIVKVTVTDVPQTPGVPAGTLQLTRQIFFTEPIVGAAVDDIDVFNPNQGLKALGINSQGNRGAVIQFDVVNATNPVLNVIPMGQESGTLKDFFSPAKNDITGLAVTNSPAGTFRFFVQFKKAGLYLAEVKDSDGRIVRKMIPVTVPDITGAQRELQDFNVSSSFITGKLNFAGGKADQLKFRARFPLVDNSLYVFDPKKEFELIVGIGNIAVTLNVPPTGKAKIMAIRDAKGNVRQAAAGTEVRFKAPKTTKAADAAKNPTRVQAIVDFRLALEDIDLAGLDSEGVTQEHGTVTQGETVLNTGGLLGGSTLNDSKIDVGETGVSVNMVTATLKKNNLVPIGIQTIFIIDRQLAYASKIPAGFVAKKNNGQLAGKK